MKAEDIFINPKVSRRISRRINCLEINFLANNFFSFKKYNLKIDSDLQNLPKVYALELNFNNKPQKTILKNSEKSYNTIGNKKFNKMEI